MNKREKCDNYCYNKVDRVITIWGAIEKSQILLSQYWRKKGQCDSTKIIVYFWGQEQLRVKGSSNRILSRFQEPI